MVEYVYTTVPGKIKPLLAKIREVGIPTKVTVQWLKAVGFTSSNDTSLVGILKYVHLIDGNGVPTSKWKEFRGSKHKQVLGEAIREGYAELFSLYPDANSRTQTELEHVFSTSSSGGKQVIAKTISTFKALVDEAEFSDAEEAPDLHVAAGPLHAPVAVAPSAVPKAAEPSPTPSLHIDVQIHISADAGSEQIEQIFASMAKHLYGAKSK